MTFGNQGHPFNDSIYAKPYLFNGSSHDLNITASSGSPALFRFTPASGEIWYLESVLIFLIDTGTTDHMDFGAIVALTNGFELAIKSVGVVSALANIKTNKDLMTFFSEDIFSPQALAFGNTADMWMGNINFNPPIILRNSDSDYVEIKIQDDLINIEHMAARVKIWREV